MGINGNDADIMSKLMEATFDDSEEQILLENNDSDNDDNNTVVDLNSYFEQKEKQNTQNIQNIQNTDKLTLKVHYLSPLGCFRVFWNNQFLDIPANWGYWNDVKSAWSAQGNYFLEIDTQNDEHDLLSVLSAFMNEPGLTWLSLEIANKTIHLCVSKNKRPALQRAA